MSHNPMINFSTLSMPADAEPGTFVTGMSVRDKRGTLVPCRFALVPGSIFVVAGDALLTAYWDPRPVPGNYTAHVTATAVADGKPMGALAIVVNIVPAMNQGGSISATPPGGTPIKGASPDDMVVIPLG